MYPSEHTKEAIAKNNWLGAWNDNMNKMNNMVIVKIPENVQDKKITRKVDRDVRTYQGVLNLDDNEWAFGTFEELVLVVFSIRLPSCEII
jgi:hypothetical protein